MESIKYPNLENTTAGALGASLPHGTHDASTGKWERHIECRTWNLGAERELGKLLAKAQTPARKVTLTLARMISQLGALSLDLGDRSEKAIALNASKIGALLAADVTYAYVFLRMQAVGNDLDLRMNCPYCGKEGIVRVDLSDMEVRKVEDHTKVKAEVTLLSPIKLKDEIISTVSIMPTRWGAIETAAKNGDHVDTAIVLTGVVAKNGVDWRPTSTDLDEMTKRDVEQLFKAMDSISPGPTWTVETECDRCNKVSAQVVDWLSPGFFRASSR